MSKRSVNRQSATIATLARKPYVIFAVGFGVGMLALVLMTSIVTLETPETSATTGGAGGSQEDDAAVPAGARLTLDADEVDFGRIGQTEAVERKLTVTNAGSETLVIGDVDAP
jgi:hypothetical protein